MPQWLYNQLKRAYRTKDRRKILLLNDCWFFYRVSFKENPTSQDQIQEQLEERSDKAKRLRRP